jgi:hypothetical protein
MSRADEIETMREMLRCADEKARHDAELSGIQIHKLGPDGKPVAEDDPVRSAQDRLRNRLHDRGRMSKPDYDRLHGDARREQARQSAWPRDLEQRSGVSSKAASFTPLPRPFSGTSAESLGGAAHVAREAASGGASSGGADKPQHGGEGEVDAVKRSRDAMIARMKKASRKPGR